MHQYKALLEAYSVVKSFNRRQKFVNYAPLHNLISCWVEILV